jgi:hypothetical protein
MALLCTFPQEHPKGARIDVAINEHYDGSYSGNPHDLYSYTGLAYCRTKPVQRMSVTQILTWRSVPWEVGELGPRWELGAPSEL